MMVKLVGMHRPYQQQVVCHGPEVWQQVGKLHATLAVPGKLAIGPHENCRFLLNEGKADILGHRFGQRLAM